MDNETSEIVKLTERISKDPKSKLFVPLAEEYKKAGDIEMAIYVLTEGLKNNPGYVTARSILGRLLLEKGDLAGSQKELEEVVKAIPDNLLAQRKLGDICVLQNKSAEARAHYKSVRSLNPRDEEIISLITDLEAGRDVKSRIAQPRPQPSPEAEAKQEIKQQAQTAPAQHAQPDRAGVTATAAGSPAARAGEPKVLKPPVAVSAAQAAEIEEPEEVLLVEPLEPEGPVHAAHETGPDILLEQSSGNVPESSPEWPAETLEAPFDQALGEAPVLGTILDEPDVFKEMPAAEPGMFADEAPVVPELFEAETAGETPLRSGAGPETEISDDFRTDTLAELYIAQGFHEKAIDIYQQMLADNPNSRGLKDKLERVKAMAAEAVATAPVEVQKQEVDIFAEPETYPAEQAPRIVKQETGPLAEPREYVPPAGKDEEPSGFTPSAAQEFARAKPAFTDFEPREYVPPQEEPVAPKMEAVSAASSRSSRKETISRLETWLTNIKKEK